MNDIFEAAMQKMSLQIPDVKQCFLNQAQKEKLVELLFSKVDLWKLKEGLLESCPNDRLYWSMKLVSCWDTHRRHPHTFVIKRKKDTMTIFFIDPEFQIWRKDKFSPSVSQAMKYTFSTNPQDDNWHIQLTRFFTNTDTKDANKISSLFHYLDENRHIDDVITHVWEKDMLYFADTKIDEEDIHIDAVTKYGGPNYLENKFESAWYILSVLHRLQQQWHIGEVEVDQETGNLVFEKKSKAYC